MLLIWVSILFFPAVYVSHVWPTGLMPAAAHELPHQGFKSTFCHGGIRPQQWSSPPLAAPRPRWRLPWHLLLRCCWYRARCCGQYDRFACSPQTGNVSNAPTKCKIPLRPAQGWPDLRRRKMPSVHNLLQACRSQGSRRRTATEQSSLHGNLHSPMPDLQQHLQRNYHHYNYFGGGASVFKCLVFFATNVWPDS